MDGEDFDAYFAGDFGTTAVLAGVDVDGIYSTETVEDLDGLVTQAPTFRLAARAVQLGQPLIVNAVTHLVRRVDVMPPDGATLRLVLARN